MRPHADHWPCRPSVAGNSPTGGAAGSIHHNPVIRSALDLAIVLHNVWSAPKIRCWRFAEGEPVVIAKEDPRLEVDLARILNDSA
jgi:hypothetical protein